MTQENRIVRPGANGTLIGPQGEALRPPEGWGFLAAGDAGLTKKVTAKGAFWRVQVPMGRRLISQGVWAPLETIRLARHELEMVRASAAYQKRLASDRQRRAERQATYEEDFHQAVRAFLAFAPRYHELEREMATAITVHAVPVGSGTVARTATLPIEERAARAVIAWMRHQTTAYESMRIPRIRGKRREIRRMLASRSLDLLKSYREGRETPVGCPLKKALERGRAAVAAG